ncbi:hypothetical protein, partial [Lactiplantibacillus mudanjiangensis]
VMVHDQETAILKPKSDISMILHSYGYKRMFFDAELPKLVRLLFSNAMWRFKFKFINSGDLFVVQYPLYSRQAIQSLTKELNHHELTKILIVHDIESVRYSPNDEKKIATEVDLLNQYDGIVVHNLAMKKWLVTKGLRVPCEPLYLFDYLTDGSLENRVGDYKQVNFAGNLKKAPFLAHDYCQTKINAFGINPPEHFAQNVEYKGVFSPEELIGNFTNGFGLVWDGTSGDGMAGVGEYMKLNSPHKVSSYLVAGIPVIISKEAALASYIVDNGLGFTIDKLSDIDDVLGKMQPDDFLSLKKNVEHTAKKLSKGMFVTSAIDRLLDNVRS